MAEEEKKISPAVVIPLIGLGLAAFAALAVIPFLREAPKEIALSAGLNRVTYTGKEQTAEDALASIMDYLVIAYHWNADQQSWEQVVTDTMMIPGEIYNIQVSQDCIWAF